MHGLSRKPRDHEQERQGEKEPPETRGYRADARQPHEPGPKRERAASKQKRGKSERMMVRAAHSLRLGTSGLPRKPEHADESIRLSYELSARFELKARDWNAIYGGVERGGSVTSKGL